ncbi:MAG: glycosyltransferase [Pseudomonadota bacterium]
MKILWHYSVLNLGGAEISTVRLLNAFAARGHQVELVLNLPGGLAEPLLSPEVRVTHLRPRGVPRPGLGALSRGGASWQQSARKPASLIRRGGDLWRYGQDKWAEFCRIRQRARAGDVDVGVVGLQGLSPRLVCEKVRPRRRIHFIRNTIDRCDPSGQLARRIAANSGNVDAYICVSDAARDALLASVPQIARRVHVVPNLLDAAAMRARAKEQDPFPTRTDRTRVLTVARLSERAKGLHRMVRVHQALRARGIDFDWYVLGDGDDRAPFEAAIKTAGLSDRMHLVGRHSNPYPFIAHADLVAVLSHYEGLSGAINEAKVLGRPVIATDVGGAREQLSGGGGLVVRSEDSAIVEGMAALLLDDQKRALLAKCPLPDHLLNDEAKIDRLTSLFAEGLDPATSRRPTSHGSRAPTVLAGEG